MSDLIRHSIDLKAKLEEVYQWTEDPNVGAMIAPAKEVKDVQKNALNRVTAYKTKQGEFTCGLNNYPRFWEGAYTWRGWRAYYETRLESFGDKWTRLTVEIDLQPRSFLARLQSSIVRSKYNRHLQDRLAAAAKKFQKA